MSEVRRPSLAAVVGVAALVVVVLLGTGALAGLVTGTETRYAEIGREMATSGDLVVPRLNGAPHLEKPPLAYWALAVAFLGFGASDVAARLPSLLAAALTVLAIAGAVARQRPAGDPDRPARGRLAALVLLTMPAFLFQAFTVSADAWLVLATTLAGTALLEADRRGGRPSLRWRLLLHAALGIGFLAKGPVVLALALGPAVVVAAARRDARGLRPFVDPLGLLAFLAIALPWFVVADRRLPGLLDLLVGRRVLGALQGGGEFHDNPAWHVWLPVVATMPWLAALPSALARGTRDRATGLALAFALAAPLLFTFSPSRLLSYGSPAVPWIAFLVAHAAPAPADAAARGRWSRGLRIGTAGVALWAVGGAVLLSSRSTSPAVAPALVPLAIVAMAAAFVPMRPSLRVDVAARAAVVALCVLVSTAALLPARPSSFEAERPLWEAVARRRRPGEALGAALTRNGDWGLFPFYSQEPVVYFGYPAVLFVDPPTQVRPDRYRPAEDLDAWMRSPERRWLLVPRKRAASLPFPAHLVAEGGRHSVVTNLPLP